MKSLQSAKQVLVFHNFHGDTEKHPCVCHSILWLLSAETDTRKLKILSWPFKEKKTAAMNMDLNRCFNGINAVQA